MDDILSDDFFHNQFKSIPAILLWTVIFLLDALAIYWLISRMGFELCWKAGSCIAVAGAFLLWSVEAIVHNRIHGLFH